MQKTYMVLLFAGKIFHSTRECPSIPKCSRGWGSVREIRCSEAKGWFKEGWRICKRCGGREVGKGAERGPQRPTALRKGNL